MAHIDRSFEMPGEPAGAQDLFLRQIAPELAKDGSFQLVHERPGELVFSDALNEDELIGDDLAARQSASAVGDEEQLSDLPAPASMPGATGIGIGFGSGRLAGPRPVNPGDSLLARHLHVEFAPGSGGTAVRIHGHARKRLRDALQRLGTPQHWPETSSLPHD
jgi:hypothetical protein